METELQMKPGSFSAELQVLLAMLALENNSDALTDLAVDLEKIDWDVFLDLARHHRVYPILHATAKKRRLEQIPPEVLRELEAGHVRNVFQMLRMAGEMERICRALDEAQIRSIILKGPVLAELLYGDVALRTCKDLDMLISMDDIERAEAILAELGYEMDEGQERILNYRKWKEHHVSYTHRSTQVQIELHWKLHSNKINEPSFDLLCERSVASPLTAYPVRMLGKEDLFMYLSTHGARHGWFRLRWLLDMDRLLKTDVEWSKLTELMGSYHVKQIGGQALLMANALFQTPLPPQSRDLTLNKHARKIADQAMLFIEKKASLSPIPKELVRYYKNYLFSLRSTAQRVSFLLSQMYPNTLDAQTLPLPKGFHFLYFPMKPFLWVFRQLKN
ncbi:nucleotidyltransferase domain-containing protein [Paenibacillus methanolicus]|uniref:Putative nucleotidyltransferase-like protein n=1 Tax=Paenibacillus methanolicus TaxID=582686 RepID=A0A5S5BVD9_9BACL|nr:nucleotidyltransferase family protein [Paenibacillus methanolicus]TYP70288.1 putative nucleotidyltransferase-like protein [Paenibacillus methanolicus]